jgi:mercuric ion transport protein
VNTAVTQTSKRSALLSYFSLFTSVGTLLCCALPSLLVLLGLGASVASMLSFLPWLATLSQHKQWTFSISGILIAISFVNTYYLRHVSGRGNVCLAIFPRAKNRAS